MIQMYPQRRLVAVLLSLFLVGTASRVTAFPTGVTTLDFADPSKGCNNCHSGGAAPVVTLEGPAALAPGGTAVYTLEIDNPDTQLEAGLNASAPSGMFSIGGPDSSNTKLLSGAGGRLEVTHTSPKMSVMGATLFSFQWTAPAGSYTFAPLTAWGNAVNGIAQNSGDQAASACLGVLPPFSEDHFKLYKAKTKKGAPAFVGPGTVTLIDEFEPVPGKITTVAKPAAFGNPANKNGEGIIDSAIHLECYKIKDAKGQTKFPGHRVQVMNQFCSQTWDVTKAFELCLPSVADPNMAPTMALPPNNVDHFKCYKAKTTKNSAAFVPRTVNLDDVPFESKETTVTKPDRFCNPVDKNGGGIQDSTFHLACYKIKDAKTDPPQLKFVAKDEFVWNQFGPEQLTATKPRVVCVPSAIVDLGPIP